MYVILMIEYKPVEVTVITRTCWCKYKVDVMNAIRGCSDFSREIEVSGLRTRIGHVQCGNGRG